MQNNLGEEAHVGEPDVAEREAEGEAEDEEEVDHAPDRGGADVPLEDVEEEDEAEEEVGGGGEEEEVKEELERAPIPAR